jgi:hypothetical protein
MQQKINRTYLLAILGMYMVTFLVISKNFFSPHLSYDEVGQFWMAKGLSHDSDPLERANGLAEVIENNKYHNLDPGGFGILLHYWTYVSNHYVWLRLLPFLFFIGIALSFIYLSHVWIKNMNIAILMGFVPVFIPMLLGVGFLVRAFSMESMGTVIGIIALERLKHKLTRKHLFLWGCALSFFMTSRYSEIIVVFIVSLYVLLLIFTSNATLKQKLLSSVVYAVPLTVTLIYIYYFALAFQNINLEPIDYLRYLNRDKNILFERANFLSLCFIGILLILFFLRNRYSIIKRYEILLFVTVFVNVLFIILSFLGKYPWDLASWRGSKCISLFLLSALCISAFLGELLKPLFNSSEILKYYFVVSLLIITLIFRYGALFPRIEYHNTYFDFKRTNIDSFHHIHVDLMESPYVRYLFEYGDFKLKKGTTYPTNFTFTKYGHHSKTQESELPRICRTWINHPAEIAHPTEIAHPDYDMIISDGFPGSENNQDKWKRIEGTATFYIKDKVD